MNKQEQALHKAARSLWLSPLGTVTAKVEKQAAKVVEKYLVEVEPVPVDVWRAPR